jgi:hypothetical protein
MGPLGGGARGVVPSGLRAPCGRGCSRKWEKRPPEEYESTMTHPKLPLCPVCEKPMQLQNIEEELAKLGVKYKHPASPYIMVCCGRTLIIENDAEWLEAIRLLKEYYHIE